MVAAHWSLPETPLVIVDGFSLLLFAVLTLFFTFEFSRQPDLLRAAIRNISILLVRVAKQLLA
jgi:hypothetical protein